MKITSQEPQAFRPHGRGETVILFSVAEYVFAASANAVREIRSIDSLSASASDISHAGVPKVRHVLRRSRKVYFVVDAGALFGLPPTRPTLVLVFRNLPIALLVDRIDRMETISILQALPAAFSGEERRWYRGLTLLDDCVVPVMNPAGLLTDAEGKLLEAATNNVAKPAEIQGVVSQ